MTTMQLVLIGLVASLGGIGSVLDSFQTHRPLILCTLTGWVLGDITTGVIIGSALEMISVGWMNVGASMAPDTALASIISTIIVIQTKQPINNGIAIAIPIAIAGQVLSIFTKTISVFFQHWGDKAGESGDFETIERAHLSALILFILRVLVPVMLVAFSMGTDSVQNFFNSIPDVVTGGLNVAGGMLMVVGYAMIINMINSKKFMVFLFMGFILSAFINMNLVGWGIFALTLGIVYLQLDPTQVNGLKSVNETSSDLDDELD